MKIKPIRRLKWQFGKLLESPRLDGYEVFDALSAAGIVNAVAYDGGGRPSHYREILGKKSKEEFLRAAMLALVIYCQANGLEYATAVDSTRALERPADYYNPNDFGV